MSELATPLRRTFRSAGSASGRIAPWAIARSMSSRSAAMTAARASSRSGVSSPWDIENTIPRSRQYASATRARNAQNALQGSASAAAARASRSNQRARSVATAATRCSLVGKQR